MVAGDGRFFGLGESDACLRLYDALAVLPRCSCAAETDKDASRPFTKARVVGYISVNLDVEEPGARIMFEYALNSREMIGITGCFLSANGNNDFTIHIVDQPLYTGRYCRDWGAPLRIDTTPIRTTTKRRRQRDDTDHYTEAMKRPEFEPLPRNLHRRDSDAEKAADNRLSEKQPTPEHRTTPDKSFGDLVTDVDGVKSLTEDGMLLSGYLLAQLERNGGDMSWITLITNVGRETDLHQLKVDAALDAAVNEHDRLVDRYGMCISRSPNLHYRIERPEIENLK